MADYNEDHAAKLKHLYKVAVKQNEKAKALTKRVADLEAAGGQANKIESIKVNGTAQAIGADKSVNITVPPKTSQPNNDSGYQTSTRGAGTVCKAGGAGGPGGAYIGFFKQKTAYGIRLSDGSSDVCSSDLMKAY